MNRSHLTPTPITDKNGKQTTVHKRGSVIPPATSRLASVKPSLGNVAKKKAKPSKVTYSHENTGVVSPDSFFYRAGLTQAANAHLPAIGTKTTVVPDETLYGFLRVGISVPEAGLLIDMGYPDAESLQSDPALAKELPGTLVRTRRWGGTQAEDRSIESVVDYLAGGGVAPQKISKALGNNINDKMLEGNVLTPEQLANLFNRYTYSVSVDEDRGTGSSRLLDAVIDGRMPYSLTEKQSGVERSISSNVHDVLYPTHKNHKEAMTEGLREELKGDPHMVLQLAQVISKHKNHMRGNYQQAVDSIKTYGCEAAVEYGPELLDARMSDGTPLGIEGATEAREVLNYLKAAIGDVSDNQYSSRNGNSLGGAGNSYRLYSNSLGIPATNVYASDLVEMTRAGVKVEDILPYMKEGLNTTRIIAVTVGNVPKPVASGWL